MGLVPTSVRWTEEELNTLKELAQEYCMSDVADKLHRPQTSVRVKAKQLGIKFVENTNTWTARNVADLQLLWGKQSIDIIAKTVYKSRSGIYSKAKSLGLPDSQYNKSSQIKTRQKRLCFACKQENDRPAPATKCSKCYKGPRVAKGTGWASRRCKNCDSGYTGKTRDYCDRDCKSEAATKARMLVLGSSRVIKTCKKCTQDFPIHKFNLDSSRKDKVHPYCRTCQKVVKVSSAETARNRRLINTYGITSEEYAALLEFQEGHCAMCPAVPLPDKNLAVDHDHNTGAVRGLLCLTCNKYKLGQLTLEDVDKIYMYLHQTPADTFFGVTKYVPTGMEKPKKRRRRK